MKTFIVLALIFAYSQAIKLDPIEELRHLVENSLGQCLKGTNYNLKDSISLIYKDLLPEDDEDFAKFFHCYWRKLRLQNELGIHNRILVAEMLPIFAQLKFGRRIDNIVELGKNSYQHCKSIADSGNDAITIIKWRNCMISHVQEHL